MEVPGQRDDRERIWPIWHEVVAAGETYVRSVNRDRYVADCVTVVRQVPRLSNMATWDEVRRIALALPETTERSSGEGVPQWRVKDKLFAWERALRRADLEALGDAAPEGAILAARVADLGAKEALLADNPDVYFTTPHFDGYPAILVRLDRANAAELEELLVEAWLARAPKRLAKEYIDASQ